MLLAPSGPPHLVLIDLGVAETLQPQQGGSSEYGAHVEANSTRETESINDIILLKLGSFRKIKK